MFENILPEDLLKEFEVFLERDMHKIDMEVQDISLAGLKSRLYIPENCQSNDVILYFHGGGWAFGGVDSHDTFCRKMSTKFGIRLVIVEYRLAPINLFPAALDDGYFAYCALLESESIKCDSIILSGDSSGGNLCASICVKLNDTTIKRPKFQLLIYPVLNNNFNSDSYNLFASEKNLTKAGLVWFLCSYTQKTCEELIVSQDPLLFPFLAKDYSVFPPTLIITAEQDILFDEQCEFMLNLKRAGVPVHQLIIQGAKHGFMTYGHNNVEFTQEALEKIKPLVEQLTV